MVGSLFFIATSSVEAGNSDWLWVQSVGGSSYEDGRNIAVDTAGNTYVTGHFSGSAMFGSTTLTSQGSDDVFVAKLNSSGEWLWAQRAGGSSYEIGYDVAVDTVGNVYIIGCFNGSASFGSTTFTSGGYSDVFVAKLNTAGEWLWAQRAGGLGDDYGFGVGIDASGNTYIGGCFYDLAMLGNTTLIGEGESDMFVAKLNSSGEWLWAESAGGINEEWGSSIAVDSYGTTSITGYFYDSATFGIETLTSEGGADVFVARLNSTGDWLWAISGGGIDDALGNGIAIDAAGNTYITGNYYNSVTFGSTILTNEGYSNVFVAKLNSIGDWLWAESAVGTDINDGIGITVDPNGHIYIVGNFIGSISFDSITLNSVGSYDVFVAKMNATRNWSWAQKAGGTDDDYGWGIAVDAGGNTSITGGFSTLATFGSETIISQGFTDIFVAQLVPSSNGNQPPNIPSYPSPINHARGASITTNLTWIGRDPDPTDTVTYDVYFGTSNPPPKILSNYSTETYDPGILAYETPYNWKIISWDNSGTFSEGPLWNFSTVSILGDWDEMQKLLADGGSTNDYFGSSISLDDNTVVIGAHMDNDNGDSSGAAYVFTRSETSWVLQQKLLANDGATDDFFGFSVSLYDNTLLIGAQGDDDNGLSSGSAYVFIRNGTTWTQQAKLHASDGAASDAFGRSVSLSGETALIGAQGDDDNGLSSSGSAYIFTRSGSIWTQQAKLHAGDPRVAAQFGNSVSLDGNTALIGAYNDDNDLSGSGAAYIFTRSDTTWTQQAKLCALDADHNDYFGISVSLSGNSALIGASLDYDNGLDSGSAYVFTRDDSTWTQQAKLLASDGEADDIFGNSVSIYGDTALIGSEGDDDNGSSTGSAYVFTRSGSIWTQQQKLITSDSTTSDGFGHTVSICEDTALIGAPYDGDNGPNSGSAYVFEKIPSNNPSIIITQNPTNGSTNVIRPPSDLNVTIEDPNGDAMNMIIRWINHSDQWVTLITHNDVYNGTYAFTTSGNDWIWGNTTYAWSVNVTDGTYFTNETYWYTTSGSRYDVNNNDVVNFIDAGLVWTHRTSIVPYDGLYDVNNDSQVNFMDAGLTWVNRD